MLHCITCYIALHVTLHFMLHWIWVNRNQTGHFCGDLKLFARTFSVGTTCFLREILIHMIRYSEKLHLQLLSQYPCYLDNLNHNWKLYSVFPFPLRSVIDKRWQRIWTNFCKLCSYQSIPVSYKTRLQSGMNEWIIINKSICIVIHEQPWETLPIQAARGISRGKAMPSRAWMGRVSMSSNISSSLEEISHDPPTPNYILWF